jgi:hypothetical protein
MASTPVPTNRQLFSVGDANNASAEYVGQYAIFRNCSEFAATVKNRPRVVCSSQMTNGPVYVFADNFICASEKLDNVVMFVCPVYREEVVCLRDNVAQSFGVIAASSLNESEITCSYAVQPQVTTVSSGVVSTKLSGSFAYTYAYSTAYAASMDLLPPKIPPIDNEDKDSASKSSAVNYIAIVVIGCVAIAFAAFLYHRTKTVKETIIPDVMPAAETEAHYVNLPLTDAINHEIIVGASGSEDANTAVVTDVADSSTSDVLVEFGDQYPDLEAGPPIQAEAEMVKIDAIAFPVLR